MNVIGLLLVAHEDDILDVTMLGHAANVDAYYALDGTRPNDYSRALVETKINCLGYWRDSELPESYGTRPRDGWREWLLEHAYADWGHDNWFVLLHGDEVWTRSPRDVASEHPEADGFVFRLPVYFPRIWIVDKPPLDQLKWNLSPGWPEFRMFRGGEGVRYDPLQHFDVRPSGIGRVVNVDAPIKHYAYRAPKIQDERARRHVVTGFDPDNYRHVLDGKTLWDEEMIAEWQRQRCWSVLGKDD